MINDVISELSRLGCKPKQHGADQYTALCPCHELDGGDHNRSLSITVGRSVPVVVNCHGGCQLIN